MDRVAPEKQTRPLPSIVFFTDHERTNMHYEMTDIEATLSMKPVPTVFIKTPSLPGIHSYLASQFIDCAARGDKFGIGPAWDDQDPVFIDAKEVSQFANWIRSKVRSADGRFETIWIQSDPRCPF